MQKLNRDMRFQDLLILGLLFIGPAAAVGLFGVLDAKTDGATPLVYLVATIVMGFTAYSYAIMSSAIPKAGAVYAYASAGIHPKAGFLAGWVILLDYLFIPAVAYLFTGISLNSIFPNIPVWIWTIGAVLLTTGLNLAGVKKSSKAAMVVLIAEVLVLGIILVLGTYVLVTVGPNRPWLSPFTGLTHQIDWGVIFAGVSIAVLSYLGFDAIATFAEENGGKKQVIGKATVGCLIVAGLLFMLQTYIGALLSPYSAQYLQAHPQLQGKAYYDLINTQLGDWLGHSLALVKAVGAAFSAMVGQAAASRLIFSMARDKRLPTVFAKIGAKSGVPTVAIITAAVVNMALAVIAANQANGLDKLVSLVDIGALTGFIMLHLSVIGYFFVKQKQRNLSGIIKYLGVPLIGIAVLSPVLLHTDTLAKETAAVWLLVGLVILIVKRRDTTNQPEPASSVD